MDSIAPDARSDSRWTAERVELRLIDAFRQMPGCPLFTGSRTLPGNAPRTAVTDAIDWRALLDDDPDGRKFLYAWARCRSSRESFANYCRAFGWPGTTAERGRRRAAATIAAALQPPPAAAPATQSPHSPKPLDSGKASLGSNRHIVTEPLRALVDA